MWDWEPCLSLTVVTEVGLQCMWLTGSEYGDSDVTFCSQIEKHYCYDVNILQICRARCAAERDTQAPVNCQFGDKGLWCNPEDLQPHSCYSSAGETCCETCHGFRTGPPGKLCTTHFHDWWPFVYVIKIAQWLYFLQLFYKKKSKTARCVALYLSVSNLKQVSKQQKRSLCPKWRRSLCFLLGAAVFDDYEVTWYSRVEHRLDSSMDWVGVDWSNSGRNCMD